MERKIRPLSIIKISIFQRLLIGIFAMLMLNTLIALVGIMSVNKLENNSKIMLKESGEHHRLQRLKLNLLQLQMPPHRSWNPLSLWQRQRSEIDRHMCRPRSLFEPATAQDWRHWRGPNFDGTRQRRTVGTSFEESF